MSTNIGTPSPGGVCPIPGSPQQSSAPSPNPSEALQKIVNYLNKNGLKGAEQALLKEAQGKGIQISAPVQLGGALALAASTSTNNSNNRPSSDTTLAGAGAGGPTTTENLSATHANPNGQELNSYSNLYQALVDFVGRSIERVRGELGALLFPVFCHMYLELVCSEQRDEAVAFMDRFGPTQDSLWAEDMDRLKRTETPEQADANLLIDAFNKNSFVLKMSKESMGQLKILLTNHTALGNLMQRHLTMETIEGGPRSKETVNQLSGGLLGEVPKSANKAKVYYSLLKDGDPASLAAFDGDDGEGGGKKGGVSKSGGGSGKHKDSKDKKKADPNAPPFNRVPLPELTEKQKAERRIAYKECAKRMKVSPDLLPSVCLYTVLNTQSQGVCSATLTEDSSMMALGFGNSRLQINAMNPDTLKPLKPLTELELLDKDADDIDVQMKDENNTKSNVTLIGHSGPVYGVSFSPDRRLLLSSSEDATVRLWSMDLWNNLAVYRIGGFPIWDVTFWLCVLFHPNSNYLATGSDDRSVRVWDVTNGNCVRHFTASKGGIQSLKWSPDGKYLASGSELGELAVWDFNMGRLLTSTKPPPILSSSSNNGGGQKQKVTTYQPVTALAFSREGNVLSVGGMNNAVNIYSMSTLTADIRNDLNSSINEPRLNSPGFHLKTYQTKSTSLLHLHWTRKNVLLGVGAYDQ